MDFTIVLKQMQLLGRRPVLNQDGELVFVLSGSLANPGQTIYLTDANRHEVGRLFPASKSKSRKQTFTIDVVDQPLITVTKLPGQAVTLFYMSRLNYWVHGNSETSTFSFKKGLSTKAVISKTIEPSGPVAHCEIEDKEAVPAVLLASVLVASWNLIELKAPDLFSARLSLDDYC